MPQIFFYFLIIFFSVRKIEELKLICFGVFFTRKVHSKITKVPNLCTDLLGDGDSRDYWGIQYKFTFLIAILKPNYSLWNTTVTNYF